eukprot:Skav208006  [mRNA]  locus=scaffold1203:256032:268222:+ [translate_table: standard]
MDDMPRPCPLALINYLGYVARLAAKRGGSACKREALGQAWSVEAGLLLLRRCRSRPDSTELPDDDLDERTLKWKILKKRGRSPSQALPDSSEDHVSTRRAVTKIAGIRLCGRSGEDGDTQGAAPARRQRLPRQLPGSLRDLAALLLGGAVAARPGALGEPSWRPGVYVFAAMTEYHVYGAVEAAAGVFRLGLERYGDREPSMLAAYAVRDRLANREESRALRESLAFLWQKWARLGGKKLAQALELPESCDVDARLENYFGDSEAEYRNLQRDLEVDEENILQTPISLGLKMLAFKPALDVVSSRKRQVEGLPPDQKGQDWGHR